MATIIDSLIVQLGLDSRDVEAKAPGVRSKLSDIEKSAKGTEKGFAGLTGAVESFGAVLGSIVSVGIITAFAKDIIETNTHLYYLSQNLGMSAQKLSAWGQVAKQLGGSSASIQGFFGQLRGMYGQYITGQTPPLQKLLAMVGINPMMAATQSPEATMLELSEKFKNADSGPNRWKAASFLEAGGLSEDVVNMVLQGPAWVKSHLKQLTPLSPSDRQAKESADLTQQLVLASTAVNKLGNNLLTDLIPLLEKIEKRMQGILEWMLKHGTTTEAIAGIGVGGTALMGVLGIFNMLKPLVLGLGAALAGLSAPITLAVAGITALSVGFYELYKDGELKKSVDSVKKWFGVGQPATPLNTGMNGLPSGGGLHQIVTAQQIEGYFKSKGYSPGWAAGIAANLMGESGGVTNASGDNGTAYGLAQWHPNYQADFRRKYGKPMSQATWQEQLNFIDSMLRGDRGIDTRFDPGAAWASSYFTKTFEKPRNMDIIAAARARYAASLLDGIPNASSVPSSVSSTNSSSVYHSDSSKNVHIGTMNVNHPASNASATSNGSHGMDWMFAPMFNGGVF